MNANSVSKSLIKSRISLLSSYLSVRHKAAYEGEGKTTVRVLNQEMDAALMVNSYSTIGFKLNNGMTVLGPMIIFPRTVLSWNVEDSSEINDGSLKLFSLLEPKIDLLILGLEASDREVSNRILELCRSIKLNAEILPTENACSTFNFLNAEGRSVAGALIPPQIVRTTDDDVLSQREKHEKNYDKEVNF